MISGFLSIPECRFQILFACKAHPARREGKRPDPAADGMVFAIRLYAIRIRLHRRLRYVPGQAHGAGGDVWLDHPRRS